MKKIIPILLLFPSLSYATEEEFSCAKNPKLDHAVECKANQNGVAVQYIELNGRECESPFSTKIYHKTMKKDNKFVIPGSKECGYVAGVTVHTHSGKTLHFRAM